MRARLKCTHDGVVVALQANIRVVHTSAVAVLVAAALRRAVVADKPKVALANPRGHARPIHAALCAHWLALAGHAEQQEAGMGLSSLTLYEQASCCLVDAFRTGTLTPNSHLLSM